MNRENLFGLGEAFIAAGEHLVERATEGLDVPLCDRENVELSDADRRLLGELHETLAGLVTS